MSVSPSASSPARRGLADSTGSEVPWEDVERALSDWMAAIRAATAAGNARKVLVLLEALVCFVSCNDGSFLHTIVSGHSMERGLRDRGAPESLISTFMEVIQCTGGMEGAILSFGSATGMPGQLAADLIASMLQSQSSRQAGGSPRARSSSPRRANCLPHRTTQDMLDQLWHASGSPSGAAAHAAAASADGSNSLQIGNLTNAVVVSVNDLSPAVLSGLESTDAVPFIILRWLNTCLVEVFFCIHHADVVHVLKRRVVYVGPQPGTQLEGQAALEASEHQLQLEGPKTLPWTDVAGLLTAPGDLEQ